MLTFHTKTTRTLLVIFMLQALLASCASHSGDYHYAVERAQIENLFARYAYAADWQDADTYASLFTEDGVLDWAGGVVNGREAIREEVRNMRTYFSDRDAADEPLRGACLRHFISNLVVDIRGDEASATAFWVEFDNHNPQRKAYSGAYGHSEDELRKINGQWLFKSRKIFNEEMDDRSAPRVNPGEQVY